MKSPKVLRFSLAVLVCAFSLLTPIPEFVPGHLKSIAVAQVITGETVTIHADSNLGASRRFTGFLHGITYDRVQNYTTTSGLLSALNPALWRLSNHLNNVYGFVVTSAQFPQNHGTLITAVIQDAFNNQYGTPIIVGDCDAFQSNCFATFNDLKNEWISYVDAFMWTTSANNATIHYYDVFTEPDLRWVGIGSSQFLELFKAAHDVVRQHQPQAKIVAPSTAAYRKNFLQGLLAYVVNNNLRLDALSWHEFDAPDDLPAHVNEVRQYFNANPSLCNPSCPEIHINEYGGSGNHLVPGWAVGWLHYLEKSEVDQSHRACWDVPGAWSTCWAGFNGVLLQDNVTKQHLYWVYKWHAETSGGTRLALDTTSPKVVALARRNDAVGEIYILMGRYDGVTGGVALQIKDYPYPYASTKVTVEKIPTNSNVATALSAPTLLLSAEFAVTNGSIRGTLPSFKDGEAYLITLKPGVQ